MHAYFTQPTRIVHLIWSLAFLLHNKWFVYLMTYQMTASQSNSWHNIIGTSIFCAIHIYAQCMLIYLHPVKSLSQQRLTHVACLSLSFWRGPDTNEDNSHRRSDLIGWTLPFLERKPLIADTKESVDILSAISICAALTQSRVKRTPSPK